MTLKTSLIISGDSSGATKAVDELVAKLETAKTVAGGAAGPMAQLDQAQTQAATSARDGATAAGEQQEAQGRGAGAARDLAQAIDLGKVAQGAMAAAAREATGAQASYGQAMAQAADDSRKLAAANDDVAGGVGAVAEQLGEIQKAQTAAATGADAHTAAIEGLQGEIKTIVAEITGGATVFDAMADRGDAVAAALQKVADASGGATSGIDAAGESGKAAGVDIGELTDVTRDAASAAVEGGGKFAGMAGVLAGPVGAAIGIAISVGAELLAQVLATSNALDDEIEKLKQNAVQADLTRQANEAFSHTQAGLAADVRALTEDLNRQNDALKTNGELKNIKAKKKLADLQADPDGVRAQLADAKRDLALAGATAGSDPTGAQIVTDASRRVGEAQRAVNELDARVADARATVEKTRVALAQENAKVVGDAIAGINKKYDAEVARLAEVKNREIELGRQVGTATQRQFDDIERRRKAAVDAEEKRRQELDRKPLKPRVASIGSQVQSEQAADLLAIAQRYTGLSENRSGDRDQLKDLFAKANGQTIDPKITAWCAAFVNAVLATDGIKGTGSLSARSFLNFGEATSKPDKGDIVVSKRGDNAAQGHVGFYQGTDAKGRVLVLGGNTGDKVGTSAIDRSDILGFRKAPTASAQYGAEQKAAADASKELAQDLAQVTQRYLPATQAAKDYADELARIEKLSAAEKSKPGTGLTEAEASEAKAAIAATRDRRLADIALTPEAKAGADAKKSIDGVIASLQQEAVVRQALSPIDAAMIAHRKELADLAKVDPAAAEERATELRGAYEQAAAIDAVEEATHAAAQAQRQFRELALDAFNAIVIGAAGCGRCHQASGRDDRAGGAGGVAVRHRAARSVVARRRRAGRQRARQRPRRCGG